METIQEILKHYSDYKNLLDYENNEVILVNDVIRFKANPYLKKISRAIDFNILHNLYHEREISLDELKQYYRDIGYSLAGFIDVFDYFESLEEETK